jgi:CMP-2-keto-3-deoxyoctulosonic acid synthetase
MITQIARIAVLVGCAISLMACAPSASKPNSDLSAVTQAEFVESVKSANGSVFIKGADINSEATARALLSAVSTRKANVVVLVQRDSPTNTASKIDLVAAGFKGKIVSMVFVATTDAAIAPFALVGNRAFYGPGLVKDGEALYIAGAGRDYTSDLEQFNTTPKRIYTGK